MHPYTPRQVERFLEKVNKRGPNECWPWKRNPGREGYGVFQLCGGMGTERAHRIAWSIANDQPVPPGVFILHTCDDRLCCNDAHLFPGDHLANVNDAVLKGRMNRGAANASAKLSEQEAQEIKNRLHSGAALGALAEEFGVHRSTVRDILKSRTWKHLASL